MTPKHHFSYTSPFLRLIGVFVLCLLLCIQTAAAAEYTLSTASAEQFKDGIFYDGTDSLTLIIEDDVQITAAGAAAVNSTAPVIIKSPAGAKLGLTVTGNDSVLCGILAPSVTIESGRIDIAVVNPGNSGAAAYGICAESDNVTISGGEIAARLETGCHKNKGIYAARYISITGGSVTTAEYGGSNTFGLDGGDVSSAGNADGGVFISGGYIEVDSGKAATRNYGIDSKYGTVKISGSAVVLIHEDESGRADNFAYNKNITTISGGNAVVFTAEGNGSYLLRSSAALSQDTVLPAGKTFVVPAGMSLGLSQGISLSRPADTILLFDDGYGSFLYVSEAPAADGCVVYSGEKPAAQATPAPILGVLAGAGAAALAVSRKK